MSELVHFRTSAGAAAKSALGLATALAPLGINTRFHAIPRLQESKVLWPITYEILRKYRVTIITTHTHMEMPGSGANLDLDLDSECRDVRAQIL
jgi:hypothetical protein